MINIRSYTLITYIYVIKTLINFMLTWIKLFHLMNQNFKGKLKVSPSNYFHPINLQYPQML